MPAATRVGRGMGRPRFAPGGGGSSAFFTDNFSTGDLTKTGGGFSWGGGNTGYVQVVTTASKSLPTTPLGSTNAVAAYTIDSGGAVSIGVNVCSIVAAGTSQSLTWTSSPESGDGANSRSIAIVEQAAALARHRGVVRGRR